MGFNYSDYINGATSRLVDLLSSNQIRREEKELYISSLTNGLADNVFSQERLEPYEVLFAKDSLLYIDEVLTKYKDKQPLDQDQLNEVEFLCERQKQNIQFFNSANIVLPSTYISNLDQFIDEIRVNFDNNCFMKKMIQLDSLITDSYKKITAYNDEECSYLFSLLNEMDKNTEECRTRGLNYSKLRNTDTAKIRDKINNNRTKLVNDSYFAQVIALDTQISKLLGGLEKRNQDISDKVIPLLDEMSIKLAECKRRGIDTSCVKNGNIDAIKNRLEANAKRIVDEQYYGTTSSVDKQISQIVDNISGSDAAALSKALVLLDELDTRIIECSNRGISIDKLRNKDTNLIRKRISDYKQAVADRSKLHSEIIGLDSEIVSTCKMWPADPNCLATIVSLCDKCSVLLGICNKQGWDIPSLKCSNPTVTKNKYLTYDEISKTDRAIINLVDEVSKENRKLLIANITKQKDNISTCLQNKWDIPELMVDDLDDALYQFNKALTKQQRKKKAKVILVVALLATVFIAVSIILLRNHYLNTHAIMPINMTDSVGSDYHGVVAELEAAGFSNIITTPVSTGIKQSSEILGITVDGTDTIYQNSYYSKEVEIVVFYSSEDRIELASTLENWGNKSNDYIYYNLRRKGLSVESKEVVNINMSANNLVASLVINGVEYSTGDCFVPEGSEVTIYYYGKACKLENDPQELLYADYKDVRAKLLSLGFDNIKIVRKDDLITGWINQEGSIASITINGSDAFKKGDVYFHNVEIVISVHTFSDVKYPYIDN